MDTKQCPCCGKEILAVAKKCKHCGEWLDENKNAAINSTPKRETVKKKSVMPMVFGITIGIILLAISLIWLSTHNKMSDEQLKKEIVGSYSFAETDDSEEDYSFTINGTDVFKSNGVHESYGTMIMSFIDEDGDKSTLKYRYEIYGKYEIKKSYIIYDLKLENIGITLMQSDNREWSELMKDYILQMKHEMIVDNKEKILELNDKYLKTEEYSYGEKRTSTYIRLSFTTESEDFATFIKTFVSDEKFQLERINFPLNSMQSKDEWFFLDSDIIFEGVREDTDSSFSGHFTKVSNYEYLYELGFSESDLIYRVSFTKINQKWMLTEFEDILEELEDFEW